MNKFSVMKFLIIIMTIMFVGILIFRCITFHDTKEIGQDNCEHEYITTSHYDMFREQYKIISKCIKCGKEI